MTKKDSAWTPYGLEAIRVAYLRRRRVLGMLLALGVAILWLMLVGTTTTTDTSILVNGQEANGISLDLPEEPEERGPVTVSLDPGRVTRADTTQESTGSTVQRADVPTFGQAPPLNWNYYVMLYGPYVLLALAAYFLAKRRGKHDEVNYGVYKGAMPLEMISATLADHVYTTREAKRSIFGKRARDYLPEQLARSAADEREEA